MTQLPKRSDSIYKEIEEFKDYELTNCIAFEMAIRNNQVFKIDEEQSELNYNLKDFDIDENIKQDILDFAVVNNYMKKSYDEFLEKEIEKSRNSTQEEIKVSQNERKQNIFKHYEIFIKNKGLDLLNDEQLYKEHGNLTNYKDFSNKTKKYLIEKSFELRPKIIEEFSRPTLKIENTLKIDIIINPNLPKDELISYVSKIKDEYDKNNSIIKSPLEILGEVLEKNNNKHTQKKPKAEKYADWFYIYDCYQILKADDGSKSNETIYNEIDLLLLEYYDSTKEDYYSIETYKKTIMKNMKYLIDELGYKELITGVRNN